MSITPPEPTPIPSIPPGPDRPPGPLEAPPPIEEPPPDCPPDEAPVPNPDENDNPPRQLKPALVVSQGEDVLTLSSFDDLRHYPFPAIPGARAVRRMVGAARNRTEMILAASSFASWAKKRGLLLHKRGRAT